MGSMDLADRNQRPPPSSTLRAFVLHSFVVFVVTALLLATVLTMNFSRIEQARFLNASVDWALNPCDDFYKFACSRWKGRHHVPSHRDERSLFTVLRRALDMDVLGVLNATVISEELQTPKQKAAALLGGCIDRRQVNRLGVAPVSRLLERHGLSGWPASLPRSPPEPALLVGELTRRLRLQPLFTTTVSVHPKDVTRRMVHVKKKYALFNDRLLEAVRKARWIHAKSSQVIQQRVPDVQMKAVLESYYNTRSALSDHYWQWLVEDWIGPEVNVPLINFPKFASTFGCGPNDGMVREEQCSLWD
ncbi:hypothetical protein V5799_023204 [Amblyomma americanum]|uniref:Peptidase M13 N-terminal domain-containing protein n=1 Tax=Amblyomma americanum TaxID=6943 RepID=A0AAQ4FIG5_AMBAM